MPKTQRPYSSHRHLTSRRSPPTWWEQVTNAPQAERSDIRAELGRPLWLLLRPGFSAQLPSRAAAGLLARAQRQQDPDSIEWQPVWYMTPQRREQIRELLE